MNVTVFRLALYNLNTVLCGVEVRALDCRSQHPGFKPLKLQNFIFKLCC